LLLDLLRQHPSALQQLNIFFFELDQKRAGCDIYSKSNIQTEVECEIESQIANLCVIQ
jgi:hypothetical protein